MTDIKITVSSIDSEDEWHALAVSNGAAGEATSDTRESAILLALQHMDVARRVPQSFREIKQEIKNGPSV